MLLGNDVVLTLDSRSVDTEGCQFQWMVQHPRFLGELETCKPGVVGVTKTGGKNQPQRLAEELVITPAVHLSKTLVDLSDNT